MNREVFTRAVCQECDGRKWVSGYDIPSLKLKPCLTCAGTGFKIEYISVEELAKELLAVTK